MALLNIFNKKKKKETVPAKASAVVPRVSKGEPEDKKKPRKTAKPAVSPSTPPKPKKISEIAYRILRGPHVTEKATDLTKQNQYVFKVWNNSNKPQIKRSIEDLYGVEVISVKVIRVPRRKRRLGRIEGWGKGYKKAIVKLKEGQKIEVLPR